LALDYLESLKANEVIEEQKYLQREYSKAL